MISVLPARLRPSDRVQTESDKTPPAQMKTFPAPVAGLVTNTPLAASAQQAAVVLENFWPTTTGIEPRGGTKRHAATPDPVRALFEYHAGQGAFFAATDSAIYQFSDTVSPDAFLSSSVSGQSSGDYAALETQTDGGSFLILVNGADPAQIYDGSSWQQVTASSTPLSITGADTSKLSHLWSHRNRVFFVEKGTMNAWYLGVNSVAGPAVKLPLAGVFNKGGSLLFGATWSSDSGAGMDDRCVFATDQGEFAVFTGGNPGDINDWRLNGVYDIGRPTGKNATVSVGGDLIVATRDGLIPISAAVSKDPAQLKLAAISRPIEPDWRLEAVTTGPEASWQFAKWPERNAAIVAPIKNAQQAEYCWVVNLETGAWSRFVGWKIGAISVLKGELYYADKNGEIFHCEDGGLDGLEPFECRACLSFDHFSAPGSIKIASAIRGTWRHQAPFKVKHTVSGDYTPRFGPPPSVSVPQGGVQAIWGVSSWGVDGWAGSYALGPDAGTVLNYWGAATWGVEAWASDDKSYLIKDRWESVGGQGKALAAQVQIVSAQQYRLDCELVSIDLVYSAGGAVV